MKPTNSPDAPSTADVIAMAQTAVTAAAAEYEDMISRNSTEQTLYQEPIVSQSLPVPSPTSVLSPTIAGQLQDPKPTASSMTLSMSNGDPSTPKPAGDTGSANPSSGSSAQATHLEVTRIPTGHPSAPRTASALTSNTPTATSVPLRTSDNPETAPTHSSNDTTFEHGTAAAGQAQNRIPAPFASTTPSTSAIPGGTPGPQSLAPSQLKVTAPLNTAPPRAAPPNIPVTPFISYAHQAGIATDQLTPQHTGEHLVPTFYSEWAHVSPEETRPVREEKLEAKMSRDHKRLVVTMLTGNHEWSAVPVTNMSYKYYVETDHVDVRPDLARFKIMRIQYQETAHEAWSKFVESRQWWLIPATLRCDRTFCRDAWECYYVDAMDHALGREQDPSSTECPLFRHDVLDRWWNAFSRKPDFLFEVFLQLTVRALVPSDSFETCHYTAEELRRAFSAVPPWMIDLRLPAGIPIPLAPIAYYFSSDLRDGAHPRRYQRAHRFLRQEQMGLAIALWYNEMMHGGRQWVLSPDSISTLRQHCLSMDIVKGVPTADILNMMMGRRVRDPTYWNTYKAGAAAVPDCHFVDCEPRSGDYHRWMTGGRIELATMRSRKVKLVLRQHRRVQVRRSSPLGSRLLVTDLLRIPGLEQYVRDQNWLQVDNIRVYDLISRIYSRFVRQDDRIKKLEQELRSTKFERDGLREALKDSDRDLERVRNEQRDTEHCRNEGRASSHAPYSHSQRTPCSHPQRTPYSHPQRTPYSHPQRTANISGFLPDRNSGYGRDQEHHNRVFPNANSPFVAPGNRGTELNDLPRVPRRPPSFHTRTYGSTQRARQQPYENQGQGSGSANPYYYDRM